MCIATRIRVVVAATVGVVVYTTAPALSFPFRSVPHAPSHTTPGWSTTTRRYASRDDSRRLGSNNNNNNNDSVDRLIPETSFGSEAVPEDQRPVNEYLHVLRQPMFDWAATESGTSGLAVRLLLLYAAVFGLVCYPISGATFTQEGYLLQKLAASNVGALLLVLILSIRLYAGWGYVGSRLTSKVIEYEETGWYDGDFERKTEAELKRDKFLYNDKVKPVVGRVRTFTLGIAGLWMASVVGYNASLSYKPLYDQYDPQMLERLSYDDRLAGKAAANTAGRPAYCDSRYYRAIANGGQGC
jgi:hypothetical protein